VKLESQILSGLIHNDSYSRKILPFIKEEYFENKVEKQVFAVIQEFIVKYNKLPEIDP
jgi:replicative DNA helicase